LKKLSASYLVTRDARVVVWLEGCKRVCAGLAYRL